MADGIAPVIEEPAILFANGQVEEALAALSRSVREADLGASALQAWLMLFDLYQHLGMRAEFEVLALKFVTKFERSPPAWIESEQRPDPALNTGGIGYCAIAGVLSEASAAEMDKLRSTAAKQQTVRIDCSALQGLDGAGCRLFREALLSIRDSGKEIVLTGESQLQRLLEEGCQPGRIETDGAVWALLLDVYRILDLKDKFEEVAVNYAVTFEMSPPSWETQVKAATRATREQSADTAEQVLVLSGEITSADTTLAKRLQDWAAVYKMLVIDMSRVPRVDFVSAGLMLNVLSKLKQAGTTIQIRSANELVHALFRVMRMDKIARIIPRK
jgi:anti-anti-sigma regulatory factor